MSDEENKYDEFSKRMEATYPKIFEGSYGGFCIGEGWWQVIESLCANIQHYIDWKTSTRERLLVDNPYDNKIPEVVSQVTVNQIKEKFGGLRFYYSGGDDTIDGMVRMAESWAAHSCEECGAPGTKRSGGWLRTLCDVHEEARQKQMKERYGNE
jgi:hypothetical protein